MSHPPASDDTGQYAGFVTRAVAFCVDIVVVFVAVLIGLGIAYLTALLVGVGTSRILSTNGAVVFAVTAPTAFALYCSVSWSWAGKTLGMGLMGVVVVTTSGAVVRFPRALLRTVGYLLSSFVLFIGYLWVLIDPRRQAWHDKVARTLVVFADSVELDTPARRRRSEVARTGETVPANRRDGSGS